MIYQFVLFIFAATVIRCHGNNGHLEYNRLDGETGGGGHRVSEINLNRWFDHYLPLIEKYMVTHGMEPMKLPEITLPVPNIPGFKPKVKLDNGLINGLSNFTRSGDIIQRVHESWSQVDMQLTWKEVQVDYDYSLKYLFYKRKGGLTGRFQNLNIALMGSVDFKARKVDLRYLNIVDASDFSLKLRGHLIDPVANAALKALTMNFRKRMLREMEHQMNVAAQLKIEEINNWLSTQTSVPIIPGPVDE